jgi:hypothetical protein
VTGKQTTHTNREIAELLPQIFPSVADCLETEDLDLEAYVSQHLDAVELQARQWEVTEIGPKFDAAQKFLKTLEKAESLETKNSSRPKIHGCSSGLDE